MFHNQKLKAVSIEDVEKTLMAQILEIRDQLNKGTLTLEYASASVSEPSFEKSLAALDDDFKMLHKELENAKSQKDSLLANGMNDADPMVDVLNWQIESAQSALETRLIELKADKRLMLKVELRIKQDDMMFKMAVQKRKAANEARQKMLMEYEAMAKLQKDLERKKKSGVNFIYMFIGLNIMAWIRQRRIEIARQMDKMHRENIAILTHAAAPALSA
jgi:vancomycin resistance protein YoaR